MCLCGDRLTTEGCSSVMVNTSWQYYMPEFWVQDMYIQCKKQLYGMCIPSDHVDVVNISPVSLIGDVNEPLRTACTLAVTTFSASIERSAWCDVLEKAD